MTGKIYFTLLIIVVLLQVGISFPQTYKNNREDLTKDQKNGFNLHIDKQKSIHVPQQKHLFIGNCEAIQNNLDKDSVIVYTDHTIIENEGPSTLNGTIEIYVDAPVKITCIKVINQNDNDNETAIPAYNSGGIGFNWVFIDVFCKYSKGFDFYIEIFGKYINATA